MHDIQQIAEANVYSAIHESCRGTYQQLSVLDAFVDKLISFIDFKNFNRPLKLVLSSGNCAADHVVDEIETRFK